MKLEYIQDLTDGGKYKNVVSENLVRLYDFDHKDTMIFIDIIYEQLIQEKKELNLSHLEFIKPINCQLILQLSDRDQGIIKTALSDTFICLLNEQSYINAIELMKAVDTGYNWLCDTSADNIDFLYSSSGDW